MTSNHTTLEILLNRSVQLYTQISKKSLQGLINLCEGEEIGKFLLKLPSKYNIYQQGSIEDNWDHAIPIIYGQVLSSYIKNNNAFYKVRDNVSLKEFTIFMKKKNNNYGITITNNNYYYFIGKINKKIINNKEQYGMFFPKYKLHTSEMIEPVYYKFTQTQTIQFKEIIENILKDLGAFTICILGKKQTLKDLFSTIHFIEKLSINVWKEKFLQSKTVLKILDYSCFFYKLSILINKNNGRSKPLKSPVKIDFQLTNSQKKAIHGISNNLELEKQTVNFLQGDVGSGKTLVAFITIHKTLINEYNVCFMSPTTILAYQHYNNFKKTFPNLSVFLIESGYKSKNYYKELDYIYRSKTPTVFFGTHNLLYEKLENIGYIIIDEQHKFGMEQRKTLMDYYPTGDILFLSATPIPRTLFMLQNNQMDLFTLDDKPFERNVTTHLVSKKEEILLDVLEVAKNSKILWINGAIEEFGKRKGVKETFKFLKEHTKDIYLIHGQMKDEEKLEIINNFKQGILVATVCVETGIDLPNLRLIVIEEAENFGLSTLHQLRGRVGRHGEPSTCILISEKKEERLEILLQTNDGFKIAEMDLIQRGYGSFFNKKQWGFDSFKSGKFNEKLFKIASEIIKSYPSSYKEILISFTKFFLKMDKVNY